MSRELLVGVMKVLWTEVVVMVAQPCERILKPQTVHFKWVEQYLNCIPRRLFIKKEGRSIKVTMNSGWPQEGLHRVRRLMVGERREGGREVPACFSVLSTAAALDSSLLVSASSMMVFLKICLSLQIGL
jgi:hypothetical protein